MLIMNKSILSNIASLSILLLLIGCQTANTNLILEDPNFTLYDLQEKTVLVIPALTIENSIPTQNQLPTLIPQNDYSNTANLDMETKLLLDQRISEELDLFNVNLMPNLFSNENNNSQILIPIYKVDNVYKVKPNSDITVDEELSKTADYFLVPLAIQLETERNVNEQFKSEELVEPGIRATMSYVFIDATTKKIVISGTVHGKAAKSGMIDRTLGKNVVLMAVNNAISELIKEFK